MSIRPQDSGGSLLPAADGGDDRHGVPEASRNGAGEEHVGLPQAAVKPPARVEEIGGPPGPEPTRYGDWQFNGRVTDF